MGSRVNARIVVVGIALLAALAALALAGSGPGADVARAQAAGTPGRPAGDDPRRPRTASRTSSPPTSPASGSATATRPRKENICVLADTYVTVERRALALVRPRRLLLAGRQRHHQQQPQQRLLLPAHQGQRHDRAAARARAAARPAARDQGGGARLRRRLQQVAARDRRRQHHRPALPRRRMGAADHRDGRLPALLPARPDREPGRRDRRHRRRAAAGRRRPDPAHARRGRRHDRPSSASSCRSAASARTPTASAATRPTTAAAWCSATRTSRGTGRSASSRRSSRSRARSTSSGASLFGVPVINIGHTDHLAWSHTVSTAYRFTPVRAEARARARPPSYIYDGQVRADDAREDVTVQVKNADGGTRAAHAHAVLDSHHGSDPHRLLGLPLFPWTPATAWAIGDANAGNFRYLNHFFEVNQAQSVDELERDHQAQPGRAVGQHDRRRLRGQRLLRGHLGGPARHRTSRRRSATRSSGRATFAALGLPVLDGSLLDVRVGHATPTRSSRASSARRNMPQLRRDDYVTNSNDSYWLSNPDQPLEGFDRIIGDERTERSLRTRSGLRDGGAAARGHRRPARQQVHAPAAPGHRVRQPPVRGRAVARRARELLRDDARRWSGRAARST